MELAVYIGLFAALLLLNAFFVVAEFSLIKVRPSRIDELIGQGNANARIVQRIQSRLDEYLAVFQVGITLASVALGMVGSHLEHIISGGEVTGWRQVLWTAGSLLIVSGSHVVLGEQVPKTWALRFCDRAALVSAKPMRFCYVVFYPALWVLSRLSALVLRLFGIKGVTGEEHHSEDELRIILDRSQEGGMMSFRRLLMIENIFDFGGFTVKDAMRSRAGVRCLHADLHWSDNLQTIRSWPFSRFPVITEDHDRPAGMIHIKDILHAQAEVPDLRKLMRPIATVAESAPLEQVMADLQRRRQHLALVVNAENRWTGIISLEDIVEEIIGTVTDEFESEPPITLAETMAPGRILLDIEAGGIADAVRTALRRVPQADLPLPIEQIIAAVLDREKLAPTYLGNGIALPHARLQGLEQGVLVFARSRRGIPLDKGQEMARLMFILLTPAGQPRVHQRLQARIAGILANSDYVRDRLHDAATPVEVIDIVRAGEQTSLD